MKAALYLPALVLNIGMITSLSCVTSLSSQVEGALLPWQGQAPDRLVEMWGAPQSSYVLDSGKKVLTYQDVAIVSRTMSYGSFIRPEVYSFSDSCRIHFYTDSSQKKIESTRFSGSPAVCLDMISNMRPAPPPSP